MSRIVSCVFSTMLGLGFAVVYHENLSKDKRYLQVVMPVLALLWTGCAMIALGVWDSLFFPVEEWLRNTFGIDTEISLGLAFDLAFLASFAFAKHFVLALEKRWERETVALFGRVMRYYYQCDEARKLWWLREDARMPRFFARTIAHVVEVMACGLAFLYSDVPSAHPAFLALILIEFASFLGAELPAKSTDDVLYHEGVSHTVHGYAGLKDTLAHYFSDRILATTSRERRQLNTLGNADLALSLMQSNAVEDQIAGSYFDSVLRKGLVGAGSEYDGRFDDLSHDRMADVARIMRGESVLFATPFYDDSVPYVFLPINTCLLRGEHVLFITGANAESRVLDDYIDEGMAFVTGVHGMWSIGKLSVDGTAEPDIARLSFGELDDAGLLMANESYFEHVGICVVLDPSTMLATYQLGLTMLSNRLSRGCPITYCAYDGNVDGLVDSLSHALRVHLVEVGATDYSEGYSTGMFFEADGPQLQMRLFGGVARYLGVGTEIELVVLREQVRSVVWSGLSNVPLEDVRWIVGQYYTELFSFAELPQEQVEIDRRMLYVTTPFSMKRAARQFIVCEDEHNNMFEAYRQYATRASAESFVCVLAPNYLMRSYMAANVELFTADPKALPAIAPDVTKSARNAFYAIVLELLSTGKRMREDEITRRLRYAGIRVDDNVRQVVETLMDESFPTQGDSSARSHLSYETRLEYDVALRRAVRVGYFSLAKTSESFRPFQGLRNVSLVTELPDGSRVIVGSRLYDLVYQTWLPGQFVTFEGKYYEIVSIMLAGGVMMRRASDHFMARTYYRQLRSYRVTNSCQVAAEETFRHFGSIYLTCERADIEVCTRGYLVLDDYSNIAHGLRNELDCVPCRSYHNKEYLRLKMSGANEVVTRTIAVIMSELFVTLFPNDHQYLEVLTTSYDELPEGVLSSLITADDAVFGSDEILVIEDSPIDIGLKQAVERNMQRILETVFEYLDWHESVSQGMTQPGGEGELEESADG